MNTRRTFLQQTGCLTGAALLPTTLTAEETASSTAISTLKPGEGKLLGKAKVVGEFNETAKKFRLDATGPKARDFTLKMVWAPERQRALFCGANHNVPHRINDAWEFDLTTMTWSMLYAPDLPRDYTGIGKDFSDVVYKDGILMTKRGGPAIIAHSWWGLAYDPVDKAMLLMNTWVTDRKKSVEQLGGDPKTLDESAPLWAFYPQTGTWKALPTPPPYPKAPFGGMLEYVPELKGTIWHTNNWQMQATWLYDRKSNTWKDLKENGDKKVFEKQAPQPEQIGYYDPHRKLLVVHRHYDTFHYDIAKNAWSQVRAGNKEDGKTPYGHDARSIFYEDTTNKGGLLFHFESDRFWWYSPDKVTWTPLTPTGDPIPKGSKRLGYFDPRHQVFVILADTTVWAFRPPKMG
ncbi:MAG: hypothetical protein R3B84_21785 [Zavarzinella sp.]